MCRAIQRAKLIGNEPGGFSNGITKPTERAIGFSLSPGERVRVRGNRAPEQVAHSCARLEMSIEK